VLMIRADYCGNGFSTTRNGIPVDIFDRLNIQRPVDPATMPLEAAWSEVGAICVAHVRVPENTSIEQLEQNCPRLRGRIGPQVCTQSAVEAGQFGEALIFNRSQ
jgi:hypothetical protein